MKTIIFILAILSISLSHAQVLESRTFSELAAKIQATDFTYKETGKLHGFNSTQSCLFVSEDIVVFKNYCFPKKPYPARGYFIITREWGITKLYEEKIPGVLLREIGVDEFPVFMAPYLQDHLPDYTLADLNGIITELYPRYNPGCWSTNFSRYVETNDVNCSVAVENVVNFDAWAKDSQDIVMDESAWLSLMDMLESKFKR